jgi:hypothetical protein
MTEASKLTYAERKKLPDAGNFSDQVMYDPESKLYRRGRFTLICPVCQHRHKPLLSHGLRVLSNGALWSDKSHKEPYFEYQAECWKTGRLYRFTVHTQLEEA